MTWKPHVTVAAIAELDAKLLMVEEFIDQQLVINQPAGHLEAGESLVQAVTRETLEETAWHFRPEYLVGIYRWQKPGSKQTFLRFSFAGRCLNQENGLGLDPDIHRAVWMSPQDILQAGNVRSPLVTDSVRDYLDGHRYPLDILNEGIELT